MARAVDWRACLAIVALLAGCAPQVASQAVQVTPGRNKTPDQFASDQATCKAMAQQQSAEAQKQATVGAATNPDVVGGATSGSTGTTAATLLGAAASVTAAGQQQYDAIYSQCMADHGNIVPGYTTAVMAPPVVGQAIYDPALVRAVQVELIRVGMLRDTADGAYGPHTRNAINGYEQANNLPVDGRPSEALLANLKQRPTPSAGLVQPISTGAQPPAATTLVAPVSPAPAGGGLVAPTTPPAPGGLVNP
jgi:hypothetical protein